MSWSVRLLCASLVGALSLALASVAGAAPAPGGPGADDGYLGSDKSGVVTSTTTDSKVWATVQKEGGLGEVYYPDLATPSSRALRLVVRDARTGAVSAGDVATEQLDPKSLTFTQAQTGPGWRLTATYVSDPQRATVLADVRFKASDQRRYTVHALFEPTLNDTRTDDTARSAGSDLVATDAGSGASALIAKPAFAKTTNNYRGTPDDDVLANTYDSAGPGAVVQAGQLALDRGGRATLALAFGDATDTALATARASLQRPFLVTLARYAAGWRDYLRGLKRPPRTLTSGDERDLYTTSIMVLAASEDKTHRGAYVASPTMPWVWGTLAPSGPYHLVWSRDLYQIATGLIAAGDTAGANRALDWVFNTQQKPDGSFPQNSKPDGTPVWTGLQMDEVAFPMILAHQLGRTDASTWSHVKRAADFLLSYKDPDTGNAAPWSPMERWENQSGWSPATIASEIAGLVCAAEIAKANGDDDSATRYLATADEWQGKVKAWTLTTTGPYSAQPYFLRLTKDGDPDAGTTYSTGDGGPSAADQRTVVDPSFLDLVRLGVLPADDPDILNSEQVVDEQLGFDTPRGFFWHRAAFDGYGEFRDGRPWAFAQPPDSRTTIGRAWPLLNGERGEAQIARGDTASATAQLRAMANAASPGGMLPEQVWDQNPPSGSPGFEPGTPTLSATPLAWTHAQYLRLAWDLADGKVSEQPAVVAERYARTK
ncbi:MAG TPA: glycoside hydrolase family 15 protein [Baekduia sp.]|nr:glycoside hydrolase family 15 protein [Baekduia sp.]